ncbi:MAG: ribose 5-phosphate isomerase B [Desulfobacterales bacterium]|jgi:ribose 5-phosphate isomerase B|nr:ribose 5-phosphate isomerase B [Desulfobacteraceae bacterium]MDD3992794.1 ribose 5-phosphate isomerase B [Desulfobacteraceae bacterium]MDY0310808.1 ribose 5-phosphate isomerase B [Desulfobacterales bacterium]
MKDHSALIIGSDHAAFPLKERIKQELVRLGYPVEDVGTHDNSSCDYPVFGGAVARRVASGEFERGILMCGSGVGMSMVANRFPGVRAALCAEPLTAALSRRHNDANILVMGGRMIGETMALEILTVWLQTAFEGDRHQRRIAMFDRTRPEAE